MRNVAPVRQSQAAARQMTWRCSWPWLLVTHAHPPSIVPGARGKRLTQSLADLWIAVSLLQGDAFADLVPAGQETDGAQESCGHAALVKATSSSQAVGVLLQADNVCAVWTNMQLTWQPH